MQRSADDHLIREAKKIVESLGKMFAPFCEVVLHDLRTPEHAIVAIENNLSGRNIGDATTNMGLERIKSRDFPDVVQNYPNVLPDGRRVKSTSIGIRNQQGRCIASICLNFDISAISGLTAMWTEFAATSAANLPVKERLQASTSEDIHAAIAAFAKQKNRPVGQLESTERRELVRLLNQKGLFRLRGSIDTTAKVLGVTRPTIYNDLKRSA